MFRGGKKKCSEGKEKGGRWHGKIAWKWINGLAWYITVQSMEYCPAIKNGVGIDLKCIEKSWSNTAF